MNSQLYPLKFKPIPQYRIWGGNHLNAVLPKDEQMNQLGEIWSISCVNENLSLVENGSLSGKTLDQIIDHYQESLVGEKIWKEFGKNFPLLIKFIDSAEPLSVQVHPSDEQAKRLHNSFGKSEMWYIMETEKEAELIIGFKENIHKEEYVNHLQTETLEEILQKVKVSKGDAVYIPAGRVHAIGAGIILAEIQQTSDITYRIYDYNRTDKDGKKRELHTEWVMDAIDFNPVEEAKTNYKTTENQFNPLVNSPYFKTRIFKGNQPQQFSQNQTMKIYICTEGDFTFETETEQVQLKKFESLLMPASVETYSMQPTENSTCIEVCVP